MNSCRKKEDNRAFIEDWIGAEFRYPDSLLCAIKNEKVEYNLANADYKIISYIDSGGCTSCKMKLRAWDKFYGKIQQQYDGIVALGLIVESDLSSNILASLKEADFNYPIWYDRDGSYKETSGINGDLYLNTFLVDCDNRVIAVGNPIFNKEIERLYLAKILGDSAAFSNDRDNLQIFSNLTI